MSLAGRFGGFVVALMAGFVPSFASAAEIVIWREVPPHSAIEPLPPGDKNAVDTDKRDMIVKDVPGPHLLNDDQVGAVFGSSPLNGESPVGRGDHPLTVATPDADTTASLTGSGSGISGLGSSVSGQVVGTVDTAMRALSGAIATGIAATRPGQ